MGDVEHRRCGGRSVLLALTVVLAPLALAPPAASAQEVCSAPVPVTNGGFEEPARPANRGVPAAPSGWSASEEVTHWGPGGTFASGSQYVALGGLASDSSGSVSQNLAGADLAGRTVTFTIISLGSGTIAMGDQSQAINGSRTAQTTHTVTFTVPSAAPASLPLTLSGPPSTFSVDQVSGSYEVPCTPILTLTKTVDNGTTGATTGPEAWTLTASGPTPISGASGTAAVTAVPVAVGEYSLSEAGPGGYTSSAWTCTGATVSDDVVTLVAGSVATCTVANTAIAPTLTLVKQVRRGGAAPTAWLLRAAGPTTISGATGSPAVTNAVVPIGSYVLAESGGPPGYRSFGWTCTGAAVSADTVTVVLGATVVCTIVNSPARSRRPRRPRRHLPPRSGRR